MQRMRFFKGQMKTLLFKYGIIALPLLAGICLGGCAVNETKPNDENRAPEKPVAQVNSVQVSGEPNAYQFSVGIMSPDKGCEQYADWWEVLSENGTLIYRRILAHSHVNEQPFVRSGQPVRIQANDVVYIRGHMHPGGYGGNVFTGTVQDGFREVTVSADFAAGVEKEPPQPTDCAF